MMAIIMNKSMHMAEVKRTRKTNIRNISTSMLKRRSISTKKRKYIITIIMSRTIIMTITHILMKRVVLSMYMRR
jgi:hypothetical protein